MLCTLKNLDFNTDASYSDATTNKPKWAKGNGTRVGWNPIGDGYPYKCIFDGQSHTISNLYINRTRTNDYEEVFGLFGYMEGGTIQNLGLVNVDVRADEQYSYTGSLVGLAENSTIRSCYVSGGTIAGVDADGFRGAYDSKIGGLIGSLNTNFLVMVITRSVFAMSLTVPLQD